MSATPARRLATAGTLALALALTTPLAAFADPAEEDGRSAGSSNRSEQAQERRQADQAENSRTGEQASAAKSDDADDRGEPAQSRPAGGERSSASGSSAERGSGKGSSDEGRAAGGDPRGNNGTVKIDGEAFDDGRGNEPHVGCVFQVDFYGFDAGDTATITFTGQAPTGGGLLHTETGTRISDDAAGGGQDRDATLTYSVSNQLSELLAIAPHPQQGWHVKLAVDVDSAPGGAKQKVFWIDCPSAPAVGGTTTSPATQDTTTTTAGAPTTGIAPTFGSGGVEVEAPGAAVAGTFLAAAERQDEVTLGAAEAETVSAQGSVAPSVLPFTGTQALLYLLALGLGAVGVGALAHRAGRRHATELG